MTFTGRNSITVTEAKAEALKKMKKGTLIQRLDIADCKTELAKARAWMKVGFTALEARGMVKGSGFDKEDGVWQVGNVPYPQAIDDVHAQKIHIWNFGVTDDEVQLTKTDNQGLTYIIG
jgi:hypothetical protein